MKIYCGITAFFCIAYYLIIIGYTRKWNSTFVLFWPIAGFLHIMLLFLPGRRIVMTLLLLGWGVFLLIEVQICLAMRTNYQEQTKWLIILGAQVRGTKITNSLRRRLDAAYIYLEQFPDTKVIVSGGQGKGEDITEAEAMCSYLETCGIERKRIYLESKSTSTLENLKNSSGIVGDTGQPVAIVTNNFHLYRALLIGRIAGYSQLGGISASSNMVLQLNYLVREFFAVLALKIRYRVYS